MKFDSLLIHGGIDGDELTGAVNVPIYQTSTYKQTLPGVNKGYEYSRTGNPTRAALEKLISDLEEGYAGFAFGSGMAAISAVLTLFKSGDKIIIPDNLYGGSFRVLDKVFKKFNLNYTITNTSDTKNIENAIDKDTRAIFIETPTNPLMIVTNIAKTAEIAKKHGLLLIVDNTFMTPYLQKPIKLGADIVVHSATKFLGGHSDLVAGLAVVNNKELADRLAFIQNSTGGVLSPFDSFLLIRGIKTLAVRMDKHIQNAQVVAEFLKNEFEVENVYYPGLKDHKFYELNKKQANGPGAVISFSLKEGYEVNKFFKALKLVTFGESLGGVESLICHPATMTHASIPKDIREKAGITDSLIRISVGIENAEDIISDLKNAFSAVKD